MACSAAPAFLARKGTDTTCTQGRRASGRPVVRPAQRLKPVWRTGDPRLCELGQGPYVLRVLTNRFRYGSIELVSPPPR